MCFAPLFLLTGQGNFCMAQVETYRIDKNQSSVAFEVTHLGVLKVNGQFKDFSGMFVFVEEKLTHIESKIEVESIDTDDTSRDQSLVDEGYLNAKEHPFIQFKSISVKDNVITGLLTIKEVEKNMEFPFHLMKKKDFYQITISTLLSRKDFNLNFGTMDALVGDEIRIELKIANLPN